MKKNISIVTVILMILMLFAACSDNGNTQAADPAPTSDVQQTGEQPANDAESPDDDDLGITSEVLIETFDNDRISIEYVQVNGLKNAEVQNALNEEMHLFCTWPTVGMDDQNERIAITVEYDIIADKYISVRTYDSVYEDDAAHPANNFRAIVFNLESGEYAGGLDAFIETGDALKEKITDGAFVQDYPEEPVEGAVEILAEEFESSQFYFTADSFGLCITDRLYAEGSYWIFEAKYDDLMPLLASGLLADLLN